MCLFSKRWIHNLTLFKHLLESILRFKRILATGIWEIIYLLQTTQAKQNTLDAVAYTIRTDQSRKKEAVIS